MHPITPPSFVYFGIDISAQTLDIAGLPKLKQLPNTPQAHAKLLSLLPPNAHVILEATGGYEQPLWLALLHANHRVTRLNPSRIRHFARSHQQHAKTDALDAAILQLFGQERHPAPDPVPNPALLQLQALINRREQLVQCCAQQQVQLKQLRLPALQQQASDLITVLKDQIKLLDQQILKTITADSELTAKAKRLSQLPGIGPTTRAILLALMPELGQENDARLCSLAGLAPHAYDSGPMRGIRRIHGGRHKVRKALYMSAITSLNHNPILKTFYNNLRNRGKPAKLALTAVMRKILCVLNKLISNPNFSLAR